jgi:hypothetical protein
VSAAYATTITCDWTDEHGDVCGEQVTVAGSPVVAAAREAGWGFYANAYIRRDRWTTGAKLWFCPVHASVFRANHGWGDLEDYGPPKRWWKPIWRVKS